MVSKNPLSAIYAQGEGRELGSFGLSTRRDTAGAPPARETLDQTKTRLFFHHFFPRKDHVSTPPRQREIISATFFFSSSAPTTISPNGRGQFFAPTTFGVLSGGCSIERLFDPVRLLTRFYFLHEPSGSFVSSFTTLGAARANAKKNRSLHDRSGALIKEGYPKQASADENEHFDREGTRFLRGGNPCPDPVSVEHGPIAIAVTRIESCSSFEYVAVHLGSRPRGSGRTTWSGPTL